MDNAKRGFLKIRGAAENNEDILGFVLTGSRGKGFENEWSDYDFAIFVKEESLQKYRGAFGNFPNGRLYVFTLDEFRDRAAWGSELDWERYTWARLKVEFDRTNGLLQKLLDEKSRVPAEHAEGYIRYSLNWFLNQVYHSIKCLRVGNMVGHRLEAAELARPFLQAIFCLHGRRLVPYYKYLRWELENFPLHKLASSADELLHDLFKILEDGDYRVQQKLLREAEKVFGPEGYGGLFDAWRVRSSLSYPEVLEE